MTRIGSLALALTGSTVFGVGVLTASIAQAACSWNFSGQWAIEQSNGTEVRLYLTQSGFVLRGKAYAIGSGWGAVKGSVSKTLRGSIVFQIFWPGNSTGDYRGGVADNGYVYGHTFDIAARSYAVENNQKMTNWRSALPLKCI
jgi:hypothetical protein